MGDFLGNRAVVAIVEMSDARIAADQDELACRDARTELLEQPKETFDRDIHDVFRRFLACGEMHDMGNVIERRCHDIAIGDRALDDVDTVGLIAQTIMTKRADTGFGKSRIVKQPSNEAPPDLARRTGNKD